MFEQTKTAADELSIARETFEMAVLHAVTSGNEAAAERDHAQLRPFYVDCRGLLPDSPLEPLKVSTGTYHPAVRSHPETCRDSLYISPTFFDHFKDMPANESAASSAMTEREVRRALALLYPHRIGQPGFTPLTAGCGFAPPTEDFFDVANLLDTIAVDGQAEQGPTAVRCSRTLCYLAENVDFIGQGSKADFNADAITHIEALAMT